MFVWLRCGHLEGNQFFQKDVWLFCGQCAGKHIFQKGFCFLQQIYRQTFCLKNCVARVLPICKQIWFKSVAGAFAINFHTKPFVKKQVVGSFAANLQADTMSQTKQPFLAHQAATTPAMASTGSQKNKRTKAPSSKKVGHNTLINR